MANPTQDQQQISQGILGELWKLSGVSTKTLDAIIDETQGIYDVAEDLEQKEEVGYTTQEIIELIPSDASDESIEKLETLMNLHLDVSKIDSEQNKRKHIKSMIENPAQYAQNLSLIVRAGITDAKIAHKITLSSRTPEISNPNNAATKLSVHLAEQISEESKRTQGESQLVKLIRGHQKDNAQRICERLIELKSSNPNQPMKYKRSVVYNELVKIINPEQTDQISVVPPAKMTATQATAEIARENPDGAPPLPTRGYKRKETEQQEIGTSSKLGQKSP